MMFWNSGGHKDKLLCMVKPNKQEYSQQGVQIFADPTLLRKKDTF
jgi:hypothetical protein